MFEYRGKIYSDKELIEIINAFKKLTLKPGVEECPLCGCNLSDNGLYVCAECGELEPFEEACHKHFEENDGKFVCKGCCEYCQEENAEWEDGNLKCDEELMEGYNGN